MRKSAIDVWVGIFVAIGMLAMLFLALKVGNMSAVSFIALYQGYEAKPTPEGVSQATTRTVVLSSLAVLALDFLLTAMMFSNN